MLFSEYQITQKYQQQEQNFAQLDEEAELDDEVISQIENQEMMGDPLHYEQEETITDEEKPQQDKAISAQKFTDQSTSPDQQN